MIQRIQSVWLFLAAMINGALFICKLLKYNLGGVEKVEGVNHFYPLLILALIITALPLVAIFMFGNRKRQKGMAILGIVATIGFLAVLFMHAGNLKNGTPPADNMEYLLPGTVLPVVSLVFFILALSGIRKDEKLIKSLDRLR